MNATALEVAIRSAASWDQVGEAMGIHRTTAMRRARAAGLDHLLQSTKYIFGKASGPMPKQQARVVQRPAEDDAAVECYDLPPEIEAVLYRNGLW